ncbi:MAG TPA: hypothetical protein VNW92_22260, partial [Polyangiaceae bacterium]|nr:hypothetical protein [Polyangiaceae bacterium]
MRSRAFLQQLMAALVLLGARSAGAADPTSPPDRFSLVAHGETHAELFQRALVPGTYGAIVANETALPVYQYVLLDARDVNIARQQTGFDLEVATWWRA